MNTTMQAHQGIKRGTKLALMGVVVTAVTATGVTGYTFANGMGEHRGSKPANTVASAQGQQRHSQGGDQKALIIDAVEYYMATNPAEGATPTAADSFQVYDIQTYADNTVARGKILMGDNTSVFYAVSVNDRWQVVYQGESTPTTTQTKQLGLPSEWAQKSDW